MEQEVERSTDKTHTNSIRRTCTPTLLLFVSAALRFLSV